MGLALALLLATASGQLQHTHVRPGGLSKVFPEDSASSNVALSFLPSNGSGAPVVGDLCSLYSGELTGAYFCLRPDGTQTSAATTTLSAQGSPATTTQALCPNRLNCSAVSMQSVSSGNNYKTANVASPLGDFSIWAVVRVDVANSVNMILAKDMTGGDQRAVYIYTDANGTLNSDLFKTDGSVTSITGSVAIVKSALHHIALTYDFVADGTSVMRLYLDGTQVASSAVAVGPVQAAASTYWGVGTRQHGSGGALTGAFRNAGLTEKVLSAGTVAAMARTALADQPTGTHGEALTFTRNSVKLCDPGSGGAFSVLPIDRPCIAGGLSVEGAATNLVLRNRDLSNAAWTKSNATCTLTATGIDGASSSASTCTASSGNATVLQAVTASAATRATSLLLRRRTGVGEVDVTRDNGSTWTSETLTSSFQRFTPQNTAALSSGGANPTIGIRIVTNGDAVDVDYVQDEVGAFATSPILTAGTSVTRATEVADLAIPSAVLDGTGCVGLTVLLDHAPPAASPRMLALNTGTYLYFSSSTQAAATDGTNFPVATPASIIGASNRYTLDWSTGSLLLTAAGVTNSTTYDGTILGTTINLGRYSSGAQLNGTISNVKLGTRTGACQ